MLPDSFKLIQTELLSNWPYHRWDKTKALVALSGGPDSVALLRSLLEISKEHFGELPGDATHPFIVAAHFDHQARSGSSNDTLFIEKLCRNLRVTCHFGVANHSNRGSSEESLREQRYQYLIKVATEIGARYLVTGHHEDDQVETILFRIFRGTGFKGLRGITPFRLLQPGLTLIRPLISVNRQDLLALLAEWNQPYLTDPSNTSNEFRRNWIRNTLLPDLNQAFDDRISKSILRLSQQANEVESFLDELCEPLMSRVEFSEVLGSAELQLEWVSELSSILLKSLYRKIWEHMQWPQQKMGQDQWNSLVELTKAESQVQSFFPGDIRFTKLGSSIQLGNSKGSAEDSAGTKKTR